MRIRDIEVFRSVMTSGSTSKAAGLLGISQPAVSQSIRRLETMADFKLFERVRSRLVPTQEAVALMRDVDRYFWGSRSLSTEFAACARTDSGAWRSHRFPRWGLGSSRGSLQRSMRPHAKCRYRFR